MDITQNNPRGFIPYASEVEVTPGVWANRCPVCGKMCVQVEMKDWESGSSRPYGEHYMAEHAPTDA